MAVDKNTVAKEAQKFAAKGQFDKAVLEWRKLLKDFPSDSSIFNTIGDLCLKKGDAKGKAEAVEAYYRSGTILAAEGFSSKAIAVYKKVLNIDPNKMEVHLALGDMNAEKGLTGNALESYKLAADYYSKNNEMNKALGIYQKMADLNPSNIAFKFKLAEMYAKGGMTKEAVKAYLEVADVHMSKDAFKDARQVFEKALALDPNNKEVYHKTGIIYYKEGKYVEACKALKPAFENDPSNKELVDMYVEALAKAGRDEEAEELYKKILSQDATRIDLREKLFRLYLARKEHDKALAEAAIIAEERLKSGRDAAGGKGLKLLPGGGEEPLDDAANAALNDLLDLVAELPDYVEARRTLSDFYAKVGRGSDAARELVQVAETLIRDNDKDGARATLNKALEFAPAMKEAKELLDGLTAPTPSPEPAAAKPSETRPAQPPVGEEAPAVLEALTEADVLVKYGLSSKALEQLEGLAKKFPESALVRIKLRDFHGDQGNVGKAVSHMLALADIYARQGAQDQAESVLRAALELEPANTDAQARLGVAPSAPEQAPTVPEELKIEEPVEATPTLDEILPPPEPEPVDITAGLDMVLPDLGEELAASTPAESEPVLEVPAEETPAAPEELALEGPLTVPEMPPAVPQPTVKEPVAAEPQAKAPDINDIWSEAEFYYQQGLFDEAKKHYAKIIQLDPGEKRAIDRLTEISREAEETQEFSKLADAVDGLEAYASSGEPGEELAASASDQEAVSTLMKEIEKLKQQTAGAPVEEEAAPAPPKKAPAVPETTHVEQRSEEDFFDLGEELRESKRESKGQETPSPRKEQPTEKSEDFFDLASELRDELSSVAVPPPSAASAGEQSLDDIFEEFKKGVERQSVREDVDTHYNLGVAYREMGLLDDAISEFVLTPEAEPKFIQSRHMLGLCYMEKGEYREAIVEIQNALSYSESLGGIAKDRVGMHYDLGLAYQGAGETTEALAAFQKVYEAEPEYRDVASKLKELREGDFISFEQLKNDIEKEISVKFLEEGERIEREEKIRKNEKVRS